MLQLFYMQLQFSVFSLNWRLDQVNTLNKKSVPVFYDQDVQYVFFKKIFYSIQDFETTIFLATLSWRLLSSLDLSVALQQHVGEIEHGETTPVHSKFGNLCFENTLSGDKFQYITQQKTKCKICTRSSDFELFSFYISQVPWLENWRYYP